MKTVLIVEDSKFFGMTIKNKIETKTKFNVVWVQNITEAIKVLSEVDEDFFAGILDFNLPDAPKGEIIDEVIKRDIPAIVFTGSVSKEIRESVWSKKVVDYVIKDAPQSLDYIINMLNRIEKNANIKVLIVDDVAFYRKALSNLLEIHRYQVFNASNGKEALDILEEHPDMKLVITDFNMPEMDGFVLTQ
jgi:CheY-like chemotaxis protein